MSARGHQGLLLAGGSGSANVSSLLHFDGTSGSTTFTDETGKVWTAQSGAVLSTSVKQFGTASGDFTAAGQALITTPNSTDFDFGAGDFTLECFVYIIGAPKGSNHTIFSNLTDTPAQGVRTIINNARVPQIVNAYGLSGHTHSILPAMAIPLNTWTHVAWTRQGSVLRTFVGGALDGQDTTVSGAITNSVYSMQIGSLKFVSNWGLNGYIEEARITKGVARYASTFTPPTAPFSYP